MERLARSRARQGEPKRAVVLTTERGSCGVEGREVVSSSQSPPVSMPAVSKPLAKSRADHWRRQQGRLIRSLRHARGLTQAELGDAVGVTSNVICLIETGRVPVLPEKVRQFAEVLRVELRPLAAYLLFAQNPDVAAIVWPQMRELFEPESGGCDDAGLDDASGAPGTT